MRRRIFFSVIGIIIMGVVYYTHPLIFGLYRSLTGREEEVEFVESSGATLPNAGTATFRIGTLPKGFPRMFISTSARRGISAKEAVSFGGLRQQTVAYQASLPLAELEAFYLGVFKEQGWNLDFKTVQEGYVTLQASKGLESVHVVLSALSQHETKVSVVYVK